MVDCFIRDFERFRGAMADDPGDLPVCADEQPDAFLFEARGLPVREEILELLVLTMHAERSKPIAGLPPAKEEWKNQSVGVQANFVRRGGKDRWAPRLQPDFQGAFRQCDGPVSPENGKNRCFFFFIERPNDQPFPVE